MSIILHPNEDGITHINWYSKGKTSVGRWLSHFTDCKIVLPECRQLSIPADGYFESIEGYWFWLSTQTPELRYTSGVSARSLGRSKPSVQTLSQSDFMTRILHANAIKIMNNPIMREKLAQTTLPFEHYWVTYTAEQEIKIKTFDDRTESYFFERVRDLLKRRALSYQDYIDLIEDVITHQFNSSRRVEETQFSLF